MLIDPWRQNVKYWKFCLQEWWHTSLLKIEQIFLWTWPSWCLGVSWCSRGDDGRDVDSSNSGPGLLCDENCVLVWKRYSVVKGLHHLKNLYSTFILFSSKNSSMFMTEKSSSSNSWRLRCFSQSLGPAINKRLHQRAYKSNQKLLKYLDMQHLAPALTSSRTYISWLDQSSSSCPSCCHSFQPFVL